MGTGFSVQALPVLGETAAPVQPCEGSFDHPAPWQNNEALRLVRALDDLDIQAGHGGFHRALEHRSLVAAIGVKPQKERIQTEQRGHHCADYPTFPTRDDLQTFTTITTLGASVDHPHRS